nr:MAG TPA: hypothetical protein [Caudoviricetes sp.]
MLFSINSLYNISLMIKFHRIMAVVTTSCIAATTFFIKFSVIKVSPPYHKYNRYQGKEATFSYNLQQTK